MLLGYTNIKSALRHSLHHYVQGAAAGHGRRDTNNLWVLLSQFNNCIAKNILVFGGRWRIIFRLMNFTGDFIKQARSMPLGLVFFSLGVAFSFYREAMQ